MGQTKDDFGNVYDDETDVSLTDPYGNPIIDGGSQDAASSPYLRSEWMRGLANGDFAVPPPDPALPLSNDAGSNEFNPLPGWAFVDLNSNGAVKFYWVADLASGSGGRIEVRFAAGAASAAEAYLTQLVAIRSTATRNQAIIPTIAMKQITAPTVGAFRGYIQLREYDASSTDLGQYVYAADYFGAAVDDVYKLDSVAPIGATTAAVEVRIGAEVNTPQPAAYSATFYEVALVEAVLALILPDIGTPTNSPFIMTNSNGIVTLQAGATGTTFFQLSQSSMNLGGSQIDQAGFVDFFYGMRMESFMYASPNISANKNNYNIWTDMGAVSPETIMGCWALASGGSWNITGLLNTVVAHGHILYLGVHQSSTGNLTLKHQSTSSSAANRIIGPNLADLVLHPGEMACLRYDGDLENRWQVIATSLAAGTGGGGTATQVSRDTGSASDYVARIKETADTQYRAILGEDSTSRPELRFGSGSAVGDVILRRRSAGRMDIEGTAAGPAGLNVRAPSGQVGIVESEIIGDTVGRISQHIDAAGLPSVQMGGGSSARDVRLSRGAVGRFFIDNPAAASTADLDVSGVLFSSVDRPVYFDIADDTHSPYTTNRNNEPTNSMWLRMEASGADRTVSGFNIIGALAVGLSNWIIATNVGTTFNIILPHESTASSAANRLNFPDGLDLTLTPGQSAQFVYDAVLQRYRAMTKWPAAAVAGGAQTRRFAFFAS